MDISIKSLVSIFLTCVMALILGSVVTLSLSINKVTTYLYQVIQQIEIYGYDEGIISELADSNNLEITVKPVDCEIGSQYEVKICFDHSFAFIKKNKTLEVSGLTRVLE